MGKQGAGTPPYYLGIDLGGTNVKAGVVDDTGAAQSSVSRPTEADRGPAHGVDRICEAAHLAIERAGLKITDIQAVGVGSPGPMDLEAQILIDPHNLPGWLNMPLAKLVGEQLGLPAILQNDANAAAFGEYWKGTGRGCKSLVQFTLGTGIGCGIVIDGKILEGRHSHGGEAGHQRIALEHARYNATGLFGSLEAYASATAVVDRTMEALAGGADSCLHKILDAGDLLTSEQIFNAASDGDQLAERIVDETAFYLAIGAVNMMHTIDPDIVAFSVGMIAAGPPFLDKIRKFVRRNALPVPGEKTRIVYAELGTEAGFIGAAGCARSKFATSPSSPSP